MNKLKLNTLVAVLFPVVLALLFIWAIPSATTLKADDGKAASANENSNAEVIVVPTTVTDKSLQELTNEDYSAEDSLNKPIYFSEATSKEVGTTATSPIKMGEGKVSVKTGTASFDTNDNPGYDSNETNTKVDQVVDENGNVLAPLPGISYEITRVSPVQGQSTFEPVVGEDAFSITVTTDQNGLARVADLASGTYQVIEKDNQLLKSVMDPVIVEVPLPQREGEALKEVFLYPKSSVVDATGTTPPGTTPDGGTQRLPQTSGNIGNAQPLYLILVFIISMGAIGIRALKTKHNKF